MNLSLQQQAILDQIQQNNHQRALDMIAALPANEVHHPRILFARTDSLYETGDDLGALDGYLSLLKSHPDQVGSNFARMGVVACLQNLSLHEEACEVLRSVDDDHEGKAAELAHISSVIERKRQARQLLSGNYR